MRIRLVVVGVLALVAAAAVLTGRDPVTPPAGVVAESYRAADWQSGGVACPSGRSSGGIADSDGSTGEPSAEPALTRLEARVVRNLPPGIHPTRRQLRPGPDRADSLLLSDDGTVGGAMTERALAGWQLTGWWSCSP